MAGSWLITQSLTHSLKQNTHTHKLTLSRTMTSPNVGFEGGKRLALLRGGRVAFKTFVNADVVRMDPG